MATIKEIWGMKINSPLVVETLTNEDLPDVTIHNNVFSVIPNTPSSINVVVPAGELCNSICQFTASANGNMPTFIMNGLTNFKINAGSISTVTQDKTYQISFLNDCCTIAEFEVVQ